VRPSEFCSFFSARDFSRATICCSFAINCDRLISASLGAEVFFVSISRSRSGIVGS
jgi:hypothetical protein